MKHLYICKSYSIQQERNSTSLQVTIESRRTQKKLQLHGFEQHLLRLKNTLMKTHFCSRSQPVCDSLNRWSGSCISWLPPFLSFPFLKFCAKLPHHTHTKKWRQIYMRYVYERTNCHATLFSVVTFSTERKCRIKPSGQYLLLNFSNIKTTRVLTSWQGRVRDGVRCCVTVREVRKMLIWFKIHLTFPY